MGRKKKRGGESIVPKKKRKKKKKKKKKDTCSKKGGLRSPESAKKRRDPYGGGSIPRRKRNLGRRAGRGKKGEGRDTPTSQGKKKHISLVTLWGGKGGPPLLLGEEREGSPKKKTGRGRSG